MISELSGIYAIWIRELLVFRREISRIFASIVQPILWLTILGGGLSAAVNISGIGGVGYQSFLFPGILTMSVLFTSVFYGLYIVWDKRIDVLKAVLVAPVSRLSIFIGKVLGGCTDTMIQATILLAIGAFLVKYTPAGLAISFFTIFLTAVAFVGMGLVIGSLFESLEGFQLVNTFLVFPLFALSGAVFPIDKAPAWIRIASSFDPVTYAVDALRQGMLGIAVFPLYMDLAIIGAFGLAMILLGSYSFSRMK